MCHKSFSFPVDKIGANSDRRKLPPSFGAMPLTAKATFNEFQRYNFQSFSTFPCLLFWQQQFKENVHFFKAFTSKNTTFAAVE